MRILIHSNAPWVGTGYGRQTALLAPRLAAAGHEVAVSAFSGLGGAVVDWGGIKCYPGGQLGFGVDVLEGHARDFAADAVVTLMDFWQLHSIAERLRGMQVLAWLPVDCSPLSKADARALTASGARPVAMSYFGARQLAEAGFPDVPMVPHMVDTDLFRPPAGRAALRAEHGVPEEAFVVGICSANSDAVRKGFPEQFRAFAKFAEFRPEALMMLHTVVRSPRGLPLETLASDLGIAERIVYSDQYAQIAGHMGDAMMADWFGMIDVLSCCSYAEAFGVPLIEAQACGTPVIVTHGSSMTELSPAGWRVPGRPFYNFVHQAWWDQPDPAGITFAYEQAFLADDGQRNARSAECRSFALQYDADEVVKSGWLPLLESL